MKNLQKGFVVPLLIGIIALLVIVGGVYIYENGKTKIPTSVIDTGFQTTNQQNIANQSRNTIYDITDLGVKFTLPNTLSDLTYVIYNLGGEQAVNSVAFSSKRLEAVGCDAKSAPLGYLTYDNNKGGTIVGYAHGSNLYFIKHNGQCKADASLQNWQILQDSLKSLTTDYVAPNNVSSPPSTTVNSSNQIAVSGMQKYTDSSFGFSFWYPNTWTVQNATIKNNYTGGTIQKTLTIAPPGTSGESGDAIIIDEFSSPTHEITIARDLCSPMSGSSVPTHRYYFDANTHTWMIEVPAYTGQNEKDGSQYSVPASIKSADVSSNTMGGLHMLGAGCSGSVIPLSANNFVVFSFNSRNVGPYYGTIAKTITATDPSIATPVSSDEQRQVITKAGVLLGTVGTKVGQWYVTSDHVYNWLGDIVIGANPLKFRLVYSSEADGVVYATDGIRVYSLWSAEVPVLSRADPATFIAIKQQYQIPYAQNSGKYGQSFTSYEVTFAKDKSYVWYEGKLIPGADPTTFVVTGNSHVLNSTGGYSLAHDARHTYGLNAKGNITIDGVAIQ